ncbi:MAG TPA: hypothetical protein VLG50_08000 [Candidatus Saccharimonadales bacterium]|nr:hypothetical protein [Candidatus Saccharimonadales bacterium]
MFGAGKTIEDVDVRILLDLDIQSLSNQCFVNKYANRFCSKQQFWINKYNHDQLPIFKPYPTTIKQWIDDYKLTLEASNILLVNEIELTKKNPIDIRVDNLERFYDKVSKLPIPDQFKSIIQSRVGNYIHKFSNHTLQFQYINHDNYLLHFNSYSKIEDDEYNESNINRDDAIKILKGILNTKLIFTDDAIILKGILNTKLIITDNDLLPYQQNEVYEYIDEYTPNYIINIINNRKKIWQYITENQNKSVVLI